MLSTHDMIEYMLMRRVGDTDIIQAASNDPVLIQAQHDGYAVHDGETWRGLGHIKPGERRVLRHIYGGVREIIG